MSRRAAREACAFFLARLEAEVRRLRDATFPGHHVGPRLWLNIVAGVIATAKGYLEQSSNQTCPNPQKLISDAEKLGGIAYDLLKHIAGAEATDIPHQVVAPFQRWVERVGVKNTIFFRAEHLPNYELGTFAFERSLGKINSPAPALLEALKAVNEPVLRVTVPGHAMGMLPHFAVVGHELGHAIQGRFGFDWSTYQPHLEDFLSRLDSRLKRAGGQLGENEWLRVTGILANWVEEIKADAVGHALGGPAFFFALCGFLELAGHSYGVSPTHPPSHLRRELLMHQLSTGQPSFLAIFEAKTGVPIVPDINSPNLLACPPGDQLFNELLYSLNALDAAACVELIPLIQAVAGEIFDAASNHIDDVAPGFRYTASQLAFDLDTHLDDLCSLIPPIEYRDESGGVHATDLASILNVGWAALITRIDKFPSAGGASTEASATKMDRMHELLLKAVELSEARQLWNEQK